jgi:hypothetical protein
MSERFTWELRITDARGRRQAVSDEGFANPYISEQSAQQVAELILAHLAPTHSRQEPQPQAVEVGVWLGSEAGGDPIASAQWTADH